MNEIFFISDTHFGHKGILKYEAEKRPFNNVNEMNQYLIKEWNKVVCKNDKIWHLGDFCLGKKYLDIARQLNGEKYLILGNHDTLNINLYKKYFNKIRGVYSLNKMILSHVPVHPQQLEYRFVANIHGHIHSNTLGTDDKRYVNVSCDALPNLAPIHYDEVLNKITKEEEGND